MSCVQVKMISRLMKSVNGLIGQMSQRASELADMKIDDLRASYPESTDTRSELVRICREERLSRGQMIEAILIEEFSLEFDQELE